MRKASRLARGLALAAMLGTTASPAMAGRGWYGGGHGGYGGWGGHHHRHRGHDDGFGAFLGAAAVIGAVAIIASSANKKKAEETRYRKPPADESDGYADDRASDAPDGAPEERADASSSEDAAVDDCAVAAREEASQGGYYAEVRDIIDAQPIDDNGWAVDGTVDQRQGYRGESEARRFSCIWRDGRVADVTFGRDDIALR
jgi:hypothetical protein